MSTKKTYYETKAKALINVLKNHNFDPYYCDCIDDAKKLIINLLGSNKVISHGGSMTLMDNDFYECLEKNGNEIINRFDYKTPEEQKELKKKEVTADAYFTSCNALTMEGEIINIDGLSNRVANIMYGPEEVYMIVGMNKVVPNREIGLSRASNVAAVQNAIRLNVGTPCTKGGRCFNCLDEHTICCNIVITRYSRIKNRIKIILVGEELGY